MTDYVYVLMDIMKKVFLSVKLVLPGVSLVKIILKLSITDVSLVTEVEKIILHIVIVQMVQLLMNMVIVNFVIIDVLIVMELLIIVSFVLITDLKSHIVDVQLDTMTMVITLLVKSV
jgi:hypothetical protein